MDQLIGPIVIRYDGLDAEQHQVDLALLGESLQGAARLISIGAQIASDGRYITKLPAMTVRVVAGEQRSNCYEIAAYVLPAVPLLPLLSEAGRAAFKKTAESVVNYIIRKASGGSKAEMEAAMETVRHAIDAVREANANTTKVAEKAIDAVVKAASEQTPAARAFAAPVGRSARTALIGERADAFIVDEAARDRMAAVDKTEIGVTQDFTVAISELDVQTGTCKLALQGAGDDGRITGHIVDPVVQSPRNPYSTALDAQSWITVVAKPHLREGDLVKLTITDIRPAAAA